MSNEIKKTAQLGHVGLVAPESKVGEGAREGEGLTRIKKKLELLKSKLASIKKK